MYDALFKQVGVIRAQTFADLLDIPVALATSRKLRGNRIAILTSTGGAGTLISDDLGLFNFDTPPPDETTSSVLRALHSGSEAVLDRNPIDVTLAGLRPDLLRGAITALLASSTYDALMIVVGSSGLSQPELMASAIQECMPNSDKPIFAYVSPYAPAVGKLLTECGVPTYTDTESCSSALSAMRHVANLNALVLNKPIEISKVFNVENLPNGTLNELMAKQLFAKFGIPCTSERKVQTHEQAELAASELGERVVLKILSSQITHKSEVGGVAVGVTAETVASRMVSMGLEVQSKTGRQPDQFLIQEMVAEGTELILGMRRDAVGTAILLGMGGVAAELFNDTTIRLLPEKGGLTQEDAMAMAKELKTWPLLDGFRGRPKADVAALVEAIVAFSNMAAQLGDRLVEAEINPVFVLPQGQGVKAADGVVVLK
jgi:acyl-CoA synthetase (NDP forming)